MATYASDHRSSPPAESQIDDLHEIVDQNPNRDTLPIACQLAPELLCHIFLHLAPTEEDVDTDPRDSRKDIIHTCQRWRNVALHYPALWSFIVDKKPSWMAFMIHRSQPAHISLHLRRSSLTDEMDRIVCDALSQTSRLSSLTIANRHVTDMVRWTNHLDPYAPNLRTLSLMLAKSEEAGVVFTPPDRFLSQGAPQLCTLVLHRCRLPSSLEPLKRLTVFRLLERDPRSPRSLDPPPDGLLTALEQMTGLVHLELSVSLVGMDKTTFHREIAFPRMQFMKVGGTKLLNRCSGLLKHLAIPRSAALEIRCAQGYSGPLYLPRRFPVMQPPYEEFHDVEIFKYNHRQLYVDGLFGHGDSAIHRPSNTNAKPSLSLAVDALWNPALVHATLAHLPINSARFVNLCLKRPHTRPDLVALFSLFPLAEYIVVNEHTATDLLSYLGVKSPLDVLHTTLNAPPTTGRLPLLKHITFSEVAIACPAGVPHPPGCVDIHAFVEVLSDRSLHGSVLPNVMFRNPIGFTKEMSSLFQAAGISCEVEGDEGHMLNVV
ncbi:hypothetical protein BKA70DRAFT_406973 [Coprinopsis sp. MPI-PUGE-AT-0042]|nr:hypothetical protein BKA70DRAFT_406973 [Coprinopsis sp. MPI-PUGE-AT-0042]